MKTEEGGLGDGADHAREQHVKECRGTPRKRKLQRFRVPRAHDDHHSLPSKNDKAFRHVVLMPDALVRTASSTSAGQRRVTRGALAELGAGLGAVRRAPGVGAATTTV